MIYPKTTFYLLKGGYKLQDVKGQARSKLFDFLFSRKCEEARPSCLQGCNPAAAWVLKDETTGLCGD